MTKREGRRGDEERKLFCSAALIDRARSCSAHVCASASLAEEERRMATVQCRHVFSERRSKMQIARNRVTIERAMIGGRWTAFM